MHQASKMSWPLKIPIEQLLKYEIPWWRKNHVLTRSGHLGMNILIVHIQIDGSFTMFVLFNHIPIYTLNQYRFKQISDKIPGVRCDSPFLYSPDWTWAVRPSLWFSVWRRCSLPWWIPMKVKPAKRKKSIVNFCL